MLTFFTSLSENFFNRVASVSLLKFIAPDDYLMVYISFIPFYFYKKFLYLSFMLQCCKSFFSGIAIIMTDVISRVPQLNVNDESLRPHALLQNLPSIICSLVLNPQPGETILDMCAAPGNKTTHISFLMKGQVNIYKKNL